MTTKNKVISILKSDFGIFIFDERLIELIDETLDWYDNDIQETIDYIVNKYDLEKVI